MGGFNRRCASEERQKAPALHLTGGIGPMPVNAEMLQQCRNDVENRHFVGMDAVLTTLYPKHSVRVMYAGLGVRKHVEDVKKAGVETFDSRAIVDGLVNVAAKENRIRGRRREIE
jgi:hypothetical protein